MNFTTLKSLSIPEGIVTQISSGGKTFWSAVKEAIKNLLPTATNTDRKTIFGGDYNGDGVNDGYITGKRLSSSGSESTLAGMCCSGFITVKEGDILRIKGAYPKASTASYVITYNSSNTKIKHQTIYQNSSNTDWMNSSSAPWQSFSNGVLMVPLISDYFGTGFDAVRFSAGVIDANTIVAINQEIV